MSGRWAATREMAWRPSQPTVRCAGNFDRAVGGVGLDAGGDAVLLEEAGGFPAHAEGEVRGSGRLPAARKFKKSHWGMRAMNFCVRGEMAEVGDGELLAAYVGGELVDLGVREG